MAADYSFQNGQGYRIDLNNSDSGGDITADSTSAVSVIKDTGAYSHWFAKIDAKGNVSLLSDELQTYLEPGATYLDAAATAPTPNTFVKFYGDSVKGYLFTITPEGNQVQHESVGGVVRLHTVDTASDRFFITETPTKQ